MQFIWCLKKDFSVSNLFLILSIMGVISSSTLIGDQYQYQHQYYKIKSRNQAQVLVLSTKIPRSEKISEKVRKF
jgi:hypothetical protein